MGRAATHGPGQTPVSSINNSNNTTEQVPLNRSTGAARIWASLAKSADHTYSLTQDQRRPCIIAIAQLVRRSWIGIAI